MAKFPGLVGDSSTSRSPIANCEETWNWYVEDVGGAAPKASPVLYPTPGFTAFALLPKSPVRGEWAQDDRMFAIGGDSLYEVFHDGSVVHRPPTALLNPSTTPTVEISTAIAALPNMKAPLLYVNGTPGTTTYGYKVTATDKVNPDATVGGETAASAETKTTVGNANLSPSNNIVVSWALVPHATGYKIYRTTGGVGAPRLLATLVNPNQTTFTDVGALGTLVTPPVANTTGSPTPSATWGYKVVATNLNGTTLPSAEGTVLGYPELSSVHYNTVTWDAIPSATGYQLYRTTAPIMVPTDATKPTLPANTLVLVATLVGGSTLTFKDTGIFPAPDAPTPTLPASNTTMSPVFPGGSTLASFATSGDAGSELLICIGGTGFIYNVETNALSAVVRDAEQGGFIDGYFVALDVETSTFKMSDYLDGLVWDATKVRQRSIAADNWVSMLVVNREIWLFGEQTSEVWVNLGTAPTPFGPNPNVFIEAGCAALHSPVRIGQELIWLGQDQRGQGLVFRPRGYTPERISTHPVETTIQRQTYLLDAEGWGYQQDGHAFYVLTFPAANVTVVYDVQTNRWAQRGVWNAQEMRFDCYRARCHCLAFGGHGAGRHLVGDRSSGQIYEMRLDVGAEIGGGVIRRVRRTPHLHSERVGIAYRRLEIDLEVGLGLNGNATQTVQGEDPTLMLRWSDDGSKTWSNEHWTSAGRMGKYRTRARWSRLGSSRDRVFELVCTDPVPCRVVDASIGVEPASF